MIVEGVLEYNSKTRDDMLKRNIGKYSQYQILMSPAIGEVYNIDYNRPFNSITNGLSLLDYTSDENGLYGSMIRSIYFPEGNNRSEYPNNGSVDLKDYTFDQNSVLGEFINKQYFPKNKKVYDEHSDELYSKTHTDQSQYSKEINFKYIDNRPLYDENSAKLNDYTHDEKTQYSKEIENKYFNNRQDYSTTDGNLLKETHNIGNTHNSINQYSEEINRKYFPYDQKEVVEINNVDRENLLKWAEGRKDYREYISDVWGTDIYSRHINYLNHFLSNNYIENGLRKTEVGVIRNPNVGFALNGVITTNQNNFSGKDTKLGTLSNLIYARVLYNGAIFNTSRHSEKKYLTPHLINVYGNNLSNVYELSDILTLNDGEYRIHEDPGADVKIVEYSKNINDLNTQYLNENIERARGLSKRDLDTDGVITKKDINGNDVVFRRDYSNDDDLLVVDYVKGGIKQEESNGLITYADSDQYGESTTIKTDDNGWNIYHEANSTKSVFSLTDSILTKTSKLFKDHTIKTMIGRFHSSDKTNRSPEFIDTAKTSEYGNSHGRNLLTKEAENGNAADVNGYKNPYCRTWTYHHQYNKVKNLIRPFTDGDEFIPLNEIQKRNGIKEYRSKVSDSDGNSIFDGGEYLSENSVISNNGFVNIAPSSIDKSNKVDIKKCMFSIENLAWVDITKAEKNKYISEEQIGPNGGRIMWFPPYDLDFQESVNVNWQESNFIGRGETVYTYANTRRQGTLSFTLLIDHPSIVNTFAKEDNNVTNNDILRFFAGCEIPEITEKKIETNTGTTVEKQENVNKVEKEISFYTFFPNNYSGYNPSTKQTDKDWWKYILCGSYCMFIEDRNTNNINNWYGYETSTYGLSEYEYKIDEDRAKRYTEAHLIPVSENYYNGSKEDIKYPDKVKSCTEAVKKLGAESKWCYKYKVDNDLRQKLCGGKVSDCENYYDTASYQLNLKTNSIYHKGANYSFAELVYALLFMNDRGGNEKYLSYLKDTCGIDEDKAFEIMNGILNPYNTKKTKITSIEIHGSATETDKTNANNLAKRRANAIKDFILDNFKCISIDSNNITVDGEYTPYMKGQSNESISSINNKLQRCVFTKIKYKVSEDELLSDTSANATNTSTNISGTTQIEDNNKAIQEETEKNAKNDLKDSEDQIVYNVSSNSRRYETESEYFKKLEKDSPLVFKSIKNKYKYFDPAFHSISPEGFNARLTFLQQCTRQGMTLESGSFTETSPAGNLAFGRMPVCIIRIGDFIYTRAIIESMNIQYNNGNGISWDMNPEGIGVQPMTAKVSLNIMLLGGQSLAGPISRLQNAVSFNYYANTGVYDDRSDIIEYEGTKPVYKKINTVLNDIADDIRTGKQS